jgi:transcriptional regulator with XRE-family HTH domain
MSDSQNPNSLSSQLAARTKAFLNANNLTQKELAGLLRVEKSSFNEFLYGQAGLNAETMLQLVRLMGLNKRDVALKFGEPDRTRAKLVHLQEKGRPLQFADDSDGWVPGQSGHDLNNASDITSTYPANGEPIDSDVIDCLRQVQNIHRSAIKAIDDYISNAQKARPNAGGSTEPARTYPTNDRSSKPGPKPDAFSKREHLEWLQEERKKTEELIRLERDTKREQEAYWQKKEPADLVAVT